MRSRVRALYRIRARPDAPGRAQEIISHELSGRVPRATLDEVKHLVGEVISHVTASTPEPGEQTITLDVATNGALRFAVTGRWRALPTRAEVEKHVGRRDAYRWGVSATREGTRVWFEASPHQDS